MINLNAKVPAQPFKIVSIADSQETDSNRRKVFDRATAPMFKTVTLQSPDMFTDEHGNVSIIVPKIVKLVTWDEDLYKPSADKLQAEFLYDNIERYLDMGAVIQGYILTVDTEPYEIDGREVTSHSTFITPSAGKQYVEQTDITARWAYYAKNSDPSADGYVGFQLKSVVAPAVTVVEPATANGVTP